jgi:hypothetical protein
MFVFPIRVDRVDANWLQAQSVGFCQLSGQIGRRPGSG